MRQRAARILLPAVFAGAVVVLAAAGIVLREPLVEQWQIHRLEGGDPAAREAALAWLERQGTARAVPSLLRCVEIDAQAEVVVFDGSAMPIPDVSSSPHARALVAILHRDPRESSVALVDALGSKAVSVVRFAAGALGRLGPSAAPAVPKILRALGQNEDFLRDVAPLLAAIGAPARPAIPLLLARIESGVPDSVSLRLAHVAGQLAAVDDVPAILALLESSCPSARRAALWVVERMGRRATTAVPALEACLHDADEEVRMLADHALTSVREDRGSRPASRDSR